MNTITIPVSEYRALIATQTLFDMIVRTAQSGKFDYAVRDAVDVAVNTLAAYIEKAKEKDA